MTLKLHTEKFRCRIHLLHSLRSNHHPIPYQSATCFLQQVPKIVVGATLMVMVSGVGCKYRVLHHLCLWFCKFHKLIRKLLPHEPQRRKFTVHISGPPWSTRVNFRKPTVCAIFVLVTLKLLSSYMLFWTSRIRQNWPS